MIELNMTEILEGWDKVREERNRLLNESDWIQWPQGILQCDMYAKWVAYRQQLRDITKSCDDPAVVVYPSTPIETESTIQVDESFGDVRVEEMPTE